MENTLRQLINETLELRKMWINRITIAKNQVKALDVKIAAYQAALKDYWEHIDQKEKE